MFRSARYDVGLCADLVDLVVRHQTRHAVTRTAEHPDLRLSGCSRATASTASPLHGQLLCTYLALRYWGRVVYQLCRFASFIGHASFSDCSARMLGAPCNAALRVTLLCNRYRVGSAAACFKPLGAR